MCLREELNITQIEEMRLEILGNMDNDSKDDIFNLYLKKAKNAAIRHMYPFDYDTITELPEKLKDWQTECAIELYKRRKSDGLTSYAENGLSESYESTRISQRLLSQLPPPKAGVPK